MGKGRIAGVFGALIAAFLVWGVFVVPMSRLLVTCIVVGGLAPFGLLLRQRASSEELWPWYYSVGAGIVGAILGGAIGGVVSGVADGVLRMLAGGGAMGLPFGLLAGIALALGGVALREQEATGIR